jgi:membrane-bound lytic murein transglycosylase B
MRFVDRKPTHRGEAILITGSLSLSILYVLFLSVLLSFPRPAFADWSPLIDRLVADGFDEGAIRPLFSRSEVKFEPGAMVSKLEELIKRTSKKSSGLPSYNPKVVYKGFLKDRVIARARSYVQENAELLEEIAVKYCVPKEILVSILLVETRFGDFVGRKGAFHSLACMALCTDLETVRPYLPKKLIRRGSEDFARTVCREKANWAYAELKALILYAYGSGLDPLSLPGSIYGAIGICQFMPSSILSYGVDADRDDRVDLFSKADALSSVANYLQGHGWKCAMDQPSRMRVILDYNRSSIYVNTVLAVAEKLKDKSRRTKRL